MKKKLIFPILIVITLAGSTSFLTSCGYKKEAFPTTHAWSYRANYKNGIDCWNPLSGYGYGQMLDYIKNPHQTIVPNTHIANNQKSLALTNLPNWNALLNLGTDYKNNKSKYQKNLSWTTKSSSQWNISFGKTHNDDEPYNNDTELNSIKHLTKIANELHNWPAKKWLNNHWVILSNTSLKTLNDGGCIGVSAITQVPNINDNDVPNIKNSFSGMSYFDISLLNLSWDSAPVYYKSSNGSVDSNKNSLAFKLRTIIEFHHEGANGFWYTTTKFNVLTYQFNTKYNKKLKTHFIPKILYSLGIGNSVKNGVYCDILSGSSTLRNYIDSYAIADLNTTPNGEPISPLNNKKFPDIQKLHIDYTIIPKGKWANGEIKAIISCQFYFKNKPKDYVTVLRSNDSLMSKDIAYDFKTNQSTITGDHNKMQLGQCFQNPIDLVRLGPNPYDKVRINAGDCCILGNNNKSPDPFFSYKMAPRTFGMDIWIYRVNHLLVKNIKK